MTSASWFNQVERWFATLTDKYTPRSTHRSTRQLEQAACGCLDTHNADPKPFVWIKPAVASHIIPALISQSVSA
jgi:hypothetical protein